MRQERIGDPDVLTSALVCSTSAGGAGAAAKAPNPEGEEGVTGAELSNEVHPGGEDGTAAGAEEKAEKERPLRGPNSNVNKKVRWMV